MINFQINKIEVEEVEGMKPETMNIIKMISKPFNERMPFEGVELTKFVQKLPFFRRFFPYQSQKFISLCLTSGIIQFRAGQNLYSKESEPNLIYILVQGSVEISSKDSKVIRIVNAYDIMGHVEVVFKLRERGEQAKTLSDVYCMVIRAEHFLEVWEKQQQIEKAYNYLRSNKYFETLTNYEKKYLSLMMIKNCFNSGETLATTGNLNDKIFFIIYGEAYVLKKLKVKGHEKEVVLQTLQEMDSFGEYEAMNKIVSQVTLRTASTGTYYSVVISEAVEIKHPFVELVKEKGLPYPDKEELEFRFEVQTEVEKYKTEIKKKMRFHN